MTTVLCVEDQSLIKGRGRQLNRGVKFYPYKKGGRKMFKPSCRRGMNSFEVV